jgi:segregation and condensation protein A
MTETTTPIEPVPHQAEMPFAYVQGEAVTTLPKDLYIPPDALEIFLEAFEGPLDLLLYLIRRQNLDILDIPIAEITRQYMEYIELMQDMRLELAAEYLVMAAMLAEIKSRMLLPRPVEEEDEDDPRAELVRRLQEYERYKQAAEDIDGLARVDRDVFPVNIDAPEKQVVRKPPQITLQELLIAARDAMMRAEMFSHHHVQMEPLSVRERMSMVLEKISDDNFTAFTSLFRSEEGRMGVVVALLAVLELIKESLIELVQSEPFAPIYIKAAGSSAAFDEDRQRAAAGDN